MHGKERIARAMHHELPDRVPVMCQLALGHYFINMRDRLKPHEIWFTSEGFTEALLTLRERYRFDGILINMPGRDPDWLEQVASIQEDPAGVETITFKDGLRVVIPPDDNALLEPNDAARVPPPDFMIFDPDVDFARVDDFPRYTWGVYHTPHLPGKQPGLLQEPPPYFDRTIKLVQDAVGDTISIHGETFSPFTHLMELFGYQNALMLLAMDAGRARAILQRLVQASVAWGLAQAALGVDAVLLSSAFAGGSFISPQMYADFVVPYERQVVDAIHAKYPEMTVYTHTCGMLDDRLELMLETNTQGVDTLDPPPLGNTTLADAKQRIGDRAFIKGNMNAVEILNDDRPRMMQRAQDAVTVGKPGGGYILSTACSVAPGVEPWKMALLVDIAEEYGRYNVTG